MATSQSGRCSRATRSSAASTARWTARWSTRRPSRAISWQWWPGSRRCRSSMTSAWSSTPPRWARSGERSSSELTSRHEFLQRRAREGPDGRHRLRSPDARSGSKRRWRVIEASRKAMFSQTLVVPLFQRYGILTQVAADNINVIKLLPPLIAGEEEIDYFVASPRRTARRGRTQEPLARRVRPDHGQGCAAAHAVATGRAEGDFVSHELARGDRVVVTGRRGVHRIGRHQSPARARRGRRGAARARRPVSEPRRPRGRAPRSRHHQCQRSRRRL